MKKGGQLSALGTSEEAAKVRPIFKAELSLGDFDAVRSFPSQSWRLGPIQRLSR